MNINRCLPIEDLKKFVKRAEPGDKITYMIGTTDWSGSPENLVSCRYLEHLQETGEFDFVQRKMFNTGQINVFNYILIKRKRKAKSSGGANDR